MKASTRKDETTEDVVAGDAQAAADGDAVEAPIRGSLD